MCHTYRNGIEPHEPLEVGTSTLKYINDVAWIVASKLAIQVKCPKVWRVKLAVEIKGQLWRSAQMYTKSFKRGGGEDSSPSTCRRRGDSP